MAHFIRLLTIIALLVPVITEAQSVDHRNSVHKIMMPDQTVEFTVMRRHTRPDPNLDVVYHWYKNNKIHVSRGDYEGSLLHDSYTVFFTNNDLKEKGQFKKGVKVGTWKTWNPDGSLSAVYQWKDGRLHGNYRLYNEDGELVETGRYKDDLKRGRVLIYEEGVKTHTLRLKNGLVADTVDLKQGKRRGINEETPTEPAHPAIKTESHNAGDGGEKPARRSGNAAADTIPQKPLKRRSGAIPADTAGEMPAEPSHPVINTDPNAAGEPEKRALRRNRRKNN